MLLELQLDDQDARSLQKAATESHMSPEHFIFLAVQDALLRNRSTATPEISGDERMHRLNEWLNDCAKLSASLPHLPESSFRREFFYED